MRKDFSRKTKRDAWERQGGLCACGVSLVNRRVEYHHINHDHADNSAANCEALCHACHKSITITDSIPRNAKIKRVRDRIRGIRKRSKFACSKDSPWKRKLDGTVVRR